MRAMPSLRATLAIILLSGAVAAAQERSFFYPQPAASSFTVLRDQAYGDLKMDVFRPANATAPAPVLIVFNTVAGVERGQPFFRAWAEIAASKGLVAIMPDLRAATLAQDFDALLAHLTANAASFGGDRDRIAVYAGSGNVYRGLPLFVDPRRTAIKAMVLYYGSADVKTFRGDVPTLFVRAGLDRPSVNRAMTDLITLAQTQNAPVSVVNYPGGHHAFEMIDDEPATRDVIDATLDFVVRSTSPAYQASIRRGLPEATAAAHVAAGDFAAASTAYADLVKSKPDDVRLRLSYGEALLGASQFAAACSVFDQLKGRGLGPRDLGLPAARACLQKGDADAAIGWLRSIPAQYRPRDIETDPTFAPLSDRADFKALFEAGR
jgi:dienelactone hydrolase